MVSAKRAVTSILRAAHLAPRSRIAYLEVQAQWGRYAMRQRDLEAGIRRLHALGLIEVDTVRGRSYLVLTDRGHRAIYSLRGWMQSMATWPRRLAHALARLRRPPAASRPRRRSSDHGHAPSPSG